MNAPTRHDPTGLWPEGELATATDFVRHFGHYAASSQNKPVYIAQHGRVGWALLSAAQMTRLSGTEPDSSSQDARFDIMIDSISTVVILVNPDFRITRMNCAGRLHFQIPESGANPLNFRDLLHTNNRDFIADICTRVLTSGDSETFELESVRYPGQTLHFKIIPFPSGLAVLADVVTQATRVRQLSSAAAAADLAIDAIDLLGRGSVDVRGAITTVNDNFIALAKSTAEKVMGLRLSTFFEQASRNAVRDAVDDVLNSGRATSLRGLMLNDAGNSTSVTMGLGAERDGGSITGAAFMVMPNAGAG